MQLKIVSKHQNSIFCTKIKIFLEKLKFKIVKSTIFLKNFFLGINVKYVYVSIFWIIISHKRIKTYEKTTKNYDFLFKNLCFWGFFKVVKSHFLRICVHILNNIFTWTYFNIRFFLEKTFFFVWKKLFFRQKKEVFLRICVHILNNIVTWKQNDIHFFYEKNGDF